MVVNFELRLWKQTKNMKALVLSKTKKEHTTQF